MENNEKIILRPENPNDGPRDAVQLKTECVRTNFTKKRDGKVKFKQATKSVSHISASMELGTFSIRDMRTGVMLTVAFDDAMVLMANALEVAKGLESRTEEVKEENKE